MLEKMNSGNGGARDQGIKTKTVIDEDFEQMMVARCQHIAELLCEVRDSVRQMRKSFRKMTRQCDPYIFYHRVRPFLSGSKGNPSLPEGVVYTDSTVYGNRRQQFAGGSAAQSSILKVIDATLGIEHSQAFLKEMEEYMPRKHREYIRFVQAKANSCSSIADLLSTATEGMGEATAGQS